MVDEDGDRVERLDFVMSHVKDGKFDLMENTIHVDKKWFYMDKICWKIYLHPLEEARELNTAKARTTLRE